MSDYENKLKLSKARHTLDNLVNREDSDASQKSIDMIKEVAESLRSVQSSRDASPNTQKSRSTSVIYDFFKHIFASTRETLFAFIIFSGVLALLKCGLGVDSADECSKWYTWEDFVPFTIPPWVTFCQRLPFLGPAMFVCYAVVFNPVNLIWVAYRVYSSRVADVEELRSDGAY